MKEMEHIFVGSLESDFKDYKTKKLYKSLHQYILLLLMRNQSANSEGDRSCPENF